MLFLPKMLGWQETVGDCLAFPGVIHNSGPSLTVRKFLEHRQSVGHDSESFSVTKRQVTWVTSLDSTTILLSVVLSIECPAVAYSV